MTLSPEDSANIGQRYLKQAVGSRAEEVRKQGQKCDTV